MTGCIEWSGYTTSDGYGEYRINGVKVRAHRQAYIEKHGPIPEGLVVRHKCDNPRCYNVEHLELGTTQDNTQDRVNRNRSAVGEQNGNSVLNEDIARAIKYNAEMSQRQLAKTYGVSQSTVSQIRSGKTWRNI